MMPHSQLVWVVLSMIKEQAEVNSFQMKKSLMTKRSTFVSLKLKICVVHSAGIVEFRLH